MFDVTEKWSETNCLVDKMGGAACTGVVELIEVRAIEL